RYTAHMGLGGRAWDSRDTGLVRDLLERQEPGRNGGHDLRGFEWYYWRHKLDSVVAEHRVGAESVAFSPDGRWLVTAGSGAATLREAATGRTVRRLAGRKGNFGTVAFSPDGKLVAVGDRVLPGTGGVAAIARPAAGRVTVWEVKSGRVRFHL